MSGNTDSIMPSKAWMVERCKSVYSGIIWDQLSYGPDLGYLLRDDFRSVCHAVNQLNNAINTTLGVMDDQPVTHNVPPESPAWHTSAMSTVDTGSITTWHTQLVTLYTSASILMDSLSAELYPAEDD